MLNLSNNGIPQTGIATLTQFALIRASGADAVNFLHGQLTNDIKGLPENQACLAGYCTPKGRLLATMLVWRSADAIMMQVPQELQEALQKRLQLFVMRAKVKLEHVSAEHTILGLFGASAAAPLCSWFPQLPAAPYESISTEAGTVLRLSDSDGVPRYQVIVTKGIGEQLCSAETATVPNADRAVWDLSEIHAGIPHITAATQEKFVPQMINYELIGGVNFKKGCYPGQEIVARSHYLGKQKRRMVLARIAATAVRSGMEVIDAADPDQPCGMVVNAAANSGGGSDCLIELKTAAYPHHVLLQSSSGTALSWLDLPYPLPDDAASDGPTA